MDDPTVMMITVFGVNENVVGYCKVSEDNISSGVEITLDGGKIGLRKKGRKTYGNGEKTQKNVQNLFCKNLQ